MLSLSLTSAPLSLKVLVFQEYTTSWLFSFTGLRQISVDFHFCHFIPLEFVEAEPSLPLIT